MKNPLCNITKKLSNVPLKLGGWDSIEGMDCFTMMITFLDDYGYDVKDLKEGIVKVDYNNELLNSKNYFEKLKSVDEMQEVLKKTIRQEFDLVDKLKVGDICIIKFIDFEIITIFLGNKKHLSMYEKYGSRVISIPNDRIKEVYRCRNTQQQ